MKNILVVDDEPDIAILIRNRLINAGFKVDVACDAVEALEKIENHVPDLITLDILMPGIIGDQSSYGASLCETLKIDEEYRKIPIIMVSALNPDGKPEISEMVRQADAYFKKPIDSVKLIEQINKILCSKEI